MKNKIYISITMNDTSKEFKKPFWPDWITTPKTAFLGVGAVVLGMAALGMLLIGTGVIGASVLLATPLAPLISIVPLAMTLGSIIPAIGAICAGIAANKSEQNDDRKWFDYDKDLKKMAKTIKAPEKEVMRDTGISSPLPTPGNNIYPSKNTLTH